MNLPHFDNEDEEREFWANHDSTDYLNWNEARQANFPHLTTSTSRVSLRLPSGLVEALKAASNARDLPYQSLMKMWLEEKLQENRGLR